MYLGLAAALAAWYNCKKRGLFRAACVHAAKGTEESRLSGRM